MLRLSVKTEIVPLRSRSQDPEYAVDEQAIVLCGPMMDAESCLADGPFVEAIASRQRSQPSATSDQPVEAVKELVDLTIAIGADERLQSFIGGAGGASSDLDLPGWSAMRRR
jgi:hypothetical protein